MQILESAFAMETTVDGGHKGIEMGNGAVHNKHKDTLTRLRNVTMIGKQMSVELTKK
jgi:hypothetical protein